MALLAGLAGFSYYLAELSDRVERPAADPRLAHEPDYFVEGFAVTRLNATGEPVFRMSAERLVHFPDDDSSEFDAARLVSLDPTKPLVTLSRRARHAPTAARRRPTCTTRFGWCAPACATIRRCGSNPTTC